MKQPGFNTKVSHTLEDTLVDSNALSKQRWGTPTCLCSESGFPQWQRVSFLPNHVSMKTTPVSLDLWHYSPPQHPPKCKCNTRQHTLTWLLLGEDGHLITTKVSSLAAWKHVVVFTMIHHLRAMACLCLASCVPLPGLGKWTRFGSHASPAKMRRDLLRSLWHGARRAQGAEGSSHSLRTVDVSSARTAARDCAWDGSRDIDGHEMSQNQ